MSVRQRSYNFLEDFERVSQFLMDHYNTKKMNGYLLQPLWEYAHTHPSFNYKMTHRFGIWEDDNNIVAIVCYKKDIGECFLFARERYEYLYEEMLNYAEKEMCTHQDGKRSLSIWIAENQKVLFQMLVLGNYSKFRKEPITIYQYDKGFKDYILPEGFSIHSLEEENNIEKILKPLWKSFDYEDAPVGDVSGLLMQPGPNFRKDASIIIKAPNGECACFAGMWFDEKNHYGLLKPLVTVPEYKHLDLASIAITEAMKKSTTLGATYCFGGSYSLYTKLGFETVGYREKWKKTW